MGVGWTSAGTGFKEVQSAWESMGASDRQVRGLGELREDEEEDEEEEEEGQQSLFNEEIRVGSVCHSSTRAVEWH